MRARRVKQKGAALLTALLSVALIASLAGTALWQQWRLTEVEGSERARLQAEWVLLGTLDWGRLILREDARQGGEDHLGEPWALPLKDARLGSFLAADKTVRADALLTESFLAGRIEDLQGRLNVRNLVDGKEVSADDLRIFEQLFDILGLPQPELRQLALGLRDALQAPSPAAPTAGFVPQRVEQLEWLGLSAGSLQKLRPFIAWLPERSTVNLNTASAEVLSACATELPLAQAQRMVEARRLRHWRTLDDAHRDAGGKLVFAKGTNRLAFNSRYFQISGQLRQAEHVLQAQALVRREGLNTRLVWRDLLALPPEDLAVLR
jgi:general secretion pathway protein K